MKSIGELMREVVKMVQSEYSKTPDLPFYNYGHPQEIINLLLEMTTNGITNKEKFPAIFLFTDIAETIDKNFTNCVVDLVIVSETLPNYSTEERVAEVFDPILYPIYELLMKYIEKGGIFRISDKSWTKYDRYSWGKNGLYGTQSNMFNDYIDAIEIKNLNLEILKTC